MATRILPGVDIAVIKEIVPQQLNPSGVVGMIGTTEKGDLMKPVHIGSYKEFTEKFGSSTDYSIIKDAKLAFLNGVYEIVVVSVPTSGGGKASAVLKNRKDKDAVKLEAKTEGDYGNEISVKVEEAMESVTLTITNGKDVEVFENLVMDATSDKYLVKFINENSKLVHAEDLGARTRFPDSNIVATECKLIGGAKGKEPSKEAYEGALEKLESEPDVDMVLACDVSDPEIHALIDAHCKNMSKNAKPRIGIGCVSKGESIEDIIKRTNVLSSDRFVLVAPYGVVEKVNGVEEVTGGVAGAVAGLISRLNYYESPTFKAITGISDIEKHYTPAELSELLKGGILAIEIQRGRGIIVEKGISTSKEQISVTRVVDHAVRGVKNISDNFIGTLNNPTGRSALKEKITEFFIRMQNEGSIVPSTDLKEPAFLVDVYCSELDFAQGIVRVDIAVRPVRAIDYIYATILVEM